MDMLTAANLSGLEAEARDKDGHSPNECFLKCRDSHCAVARNAIDLERKSWIRLMKSARGQAEVSLRIADESEEVGQNAEDIRSKHRRSDSLSSCDTNSSSSSEEEYVDAYDGNEKED